MTFLFAIRVPDITIKERDDKSRTEKKRRRIDVTTPSGLEPVKSDCAIKRNRDAQKLEKNSETNSGATFEEPPKS